MILGLSPEHAATVVGVLAMLYAFWGKRVVVRIEKRQRQAPISELDI